MKSSAVLFSIVIVPFILIGCASIVSKSSWPIFIGTNPSGATLSITNSKGQVIYQARTPAALKLRSGAGFFTKESYRIRISMEGFDERIIPVECKLNAWYTGNIIFGGPVGLLIVDPATGAMYKLSTDVVHATLTATVTHAVPLLRILNLDQVPESLRCQRVSIK